MGAWWKALLCCEGLSPLTRIRHALNYGAATAKTALSPTFLIDGCLPPFSSFAVLGNAQSFRFPRFFLFFVGVIFLPSTASADVCATAVQCVCKIDCRKRPENCCTVFLRYHVERVAACARSSGRNGLAATGNIVVGELTGINYCSCLTSTMVQHFLSFLHPRYSVVHH